jgi:hypothetical protein
MTAHELQQRVLRGELILVGEYRGSRAESYGYVDRKSGQDKKEVRVLHIIERACTGGIDRAVIYQKRPDLENPDDAAFPYQRGKPYAYFIDGFKNERGQFSGWMGLREPELIESDGEAGCAPQGALPPP